MTDSVKIAIDILLALMTGGILLFFLEVIHLEGAVSKEFKEVMNPFYHKLSKYLVYLNYHRFNLIAHDDQGKLFIKQIESISRKGLESVTSGRDISYLSAEELEKLCYAINDKIWYTLDRGGQLMDNLSLDDSFNKDDAKKAIYEVFPNFNGRSLDVGLLYESSGKFFAEIWQPVEHCTSNYEYFVEEEKKARNVILFALALTVVCLFLIMYINALHTSVIPCIMVVVITAIFAFALKQISFISSLSKRILRSTRTEMEENKNRNNMCLRKIIRWLEPIGLALVLSSFGWQCLEEHSRQTRIDGYFSELNSRVNAIWTAVYDEALDSERYKGETVLSVDYDALNTQFKEWKDANTDYSLVEYQSQLFFRIRVVLYVLGSVLIIVSKFPKEKTR